MVRGFRIGCGAGFSSDRLDPAVDLGRRGGLDTLLTGPVVRYELPDPAGLHFVMDDAPEGGVNGSLNLDGHGKSWCSLVLGLAVTLPVDCPGHPAPRTSR